MKMVGLAGETSNRCRTNSLSRFASQTAAARGDEGLGSAIFSLREKWVVGRAGLEPATTKLKVGDSNCNNLLIKRSFANRKNRIG
jgi:hypothetical protein